MKDKEKKEHFIHFIEKWIIIGLVLFILVQVSARIIIDATVPKEYQKAHEEYTENYLGHWYDGTFFINMTVDENYESKEKYQEMLNNYHSNIRKDIYLYAGSVYWSIHL